MNGQIIVDDAHADTAAQMIASVMSKRGSFEIVRLSEFLFNSGVYFDEDSGYLRRQGQASKSSPEVDVICNRVVKISRQTVSTMDGQRNVLNPKFVLAAYAEALAAYPRVWGGLGTYPAGHLLPLNLQWRAVAARSRGLRTPKFFYGFGAQEVDVSGFQSPIWKSPFDVHSWQPTPGAEGPELHKFVVDRPAGDPLVMYFVGDTAEAFALKSPNEEVDSATKKRLNACVPVLRDAFQAFMGESLFFVDGESLTFAGFTPHLLTATTHSRFAATIDAGLN